jgi:hypothetical protein
VKEYASKELSEELQTTAEKVLKVLLFEVRICKIGFAFSELEEEREGQFYRQFREE